MIQLRRLAILLLLPAVLLGCSSSGTRDVNDQRALVNEAAATASRLITDPQFSNLRQYIKNAKAVLIIPNMYRAGFVVGGEYGKGILVVKTTSTTVTTTTTTPPYNPNGGAIETDDLQSGAKTISGPAHNLSDPAPVTTTTTPGWGNPLFYKLSGGSFGLQIGGQSAEIIITIMTDKGLQKLLNNSVKLGADLSIAVGPVGENMAAGTALSTGADMYTFGNAAGLYAGISLSGAVLSEDTNQDIMVYGTQAKPDDIMLRSDGPLVEMQNLRTALNQ
jgi:lipid-binding SYLF domain-containing protein